MNRRAGEEAAVALIREGSFDDFAAKISAKARESLGADDREEGLGSLGNIGVLREATRPAQEAQVEFPVSAEPRGLALKSLMFEKGFEGFLGEMFAADSEVYYLSWAFDLSGKPAALHPPKDVKAEDVIHKARPGEVLKYLGDGSLLFPARKVTSGIVLRIQLWESDSKSRRFGETLKTVADEIEKSELNKLLELIALAGGPTTATLTLIEEAAVQLAKVVAIILKANSDDFVDYYEGYFSASTPWSAGEETYNGPYSEIVLGRLAG